MHGWYVGGRHRCDKNRASSSRRTFKGGGSVPVRFVPRVYPRRVQTLCRVTICPGLPRIISHASTAPAPLLNAEASPPA